MAKLVACLATVLCGCTSAPPPEPVRTIPAAWVQTEAELGTLQVGRVVQVTREAHEIKVGRDTGTVVVVFMSGGIPLFVPVGTRSYRHGEIYFRHVIQLKGTDQFIARDEYAVYEVGTCVAMRETPQLVVPAYPKACD